MHATKPCDNLFILDFQDNIRTDKTKLWPQKINNQVIVTYTRDKDHIKKNEFQPHQYTSTSHPSIHNDDSHTYIHIYIHTYMHTYIHNDDSLHEDSISFKDFE